MKMKFGFSLLILLLTNIYFIHAQTYDTIPATITPPDSIKVCSDNIFNIELMVDSLTHIEVQVLVMDSASIADTSCAGLSPVFMSLDGSNPDILNESYDPLTSTWSCDIDSGFVEFSLNIVIDCSVIQDNSINGTLSNIFFNQIWKGENDDIFNINGLSDDTLTSSNIFSPFILPVLSTPLITAYGNTEELLFEYENKGIGADIMFWFDPNGLGANCSGYQQVDSLEYGIFDPLGIGSYNTYTPLSWQSIYLPADYSIVIRRRIEIIDCLHPCNNESRQFKWRCKNSPEAEAVFCEDCQEIFTDTYVLSQDTSRIELSRLLPDSATAASDFSCINEPVVWTYRIRNTGPGIIPSSIINLSGYPGPVNLTVIPRDSIGISTAGCTGCTVDSISYEKVNVPFCGIPNLLDSLIITIHELGENDYIDVIFSTIRCCAESDAVLMNAGKNFNTWNITVNGTDSCSNNAVISYAAHPNYPYAGAYGISGQFSNPNPDLHLDIEFVPLITTLTVPKDSVFGPSAPMVVTFNGMFPGGITDHQILGCDSTTNCLWKGYLRATIFTEKGLHISDFASVHFSDLSGTWNPEFYYTDKSSTDSCLAGNYYFYFNLSDPQAKEMISEESFLYTLQTCCDAAPVSEYRSDFQLWINPDHCDSLQAGSTVYDPPVCTTCCWIPLSSRGHHIDVHCPGCKHPGIIVDAYKLERLNYGLRDSSNNQRADLPIAQIEKDSLYYNTHGLHTKYSMHGDLLQDIMVAHFEPGTNYTYDTMKVHNATLKYLQLNRSIENSLLMGLTVQDFDFYVDVRDTSGPVCIDCNDISDTLFTTIHQLHVPFGNLANYIAVPDTDIFFFNFDLDSTNNLFDNVIYSDSTFTSFEEGQRYRLTVRYSVCGNYISQSEDFKISDCNNFLWFSVDPKPFDMDNMAPDSLPLVVDSAWFAQYQYYCEKFSDYHVFVSNSYRNSSPALNEGCDNGISFIAVSQIGSFENNSDLFPFEFRTPAYKPVIYQAVLPSGVTLSGQSYSSNNINGTSASLSTDFNLPLPALPNTYTTSDSIYAPPVCVTDTTNVAQPNELYVYDQYLQINLETELEFNACAPGYELVLDSVFIYFADNRGGCIQYVDTLCANDTLLMINEKGAGHAPIRQPDPVLTLQILELTVGATQTEICWHFTITNADTALTGAPNVYILAPDSATYPHLINWNIQPSAGSPVWPDSNGVFHVDDLLPGGSSASGDICATFSMCDSASVPFIWGWNCNNYPSSADTAAHCFKDTTFLHIDISQGSFIAPNKNSPPGPVALCDTIYFGVTYDPSDSGYVYPYAIALTDIPSSLEIIDAQLSSNTDTIQLLPADAGSWMISDSMLIALGLPDSGYNATNQLTTTYTAILQCSFETAMALPDHHLDYHNYCGDSSSVFTAFNDSLDITGSHCSNCFSVTKTVETDTVVALADTVTYLIEVCSNNASSQIISLEEHLPANFTVTASNFPVADTLAADTCVIYTVSGFFTLGGSCQDNINIVEVTSGTTVIEADTCLTVMPACFSWSYLFVPDSSFASSYGAGFFNQTIYIDGRFYVDTNFFTIQNCTILVNTGGQIIVLSGAALDIDSSLIEGCDAMWRGMYVEETGSLQISEESIVRDADIAVFANNKSRIYFINSDFENNMRGLYIPPRDSGNLITHLFRGNTFGMTNPAFKSHYPGQAPTGNIPYSGMEVHDMILFTVGSSAPGDQNYFYNMNLGIIGWRSVMKSINNQFEHIQRDTTNSNEVWYGSAITSIDTGYVKPGKLEVEPVSSATWTMDSCRIGIFTNHSSLKAERVDMTDMLTGILSRRTFISAQVSECQIEARRFGIDWRLNAGATQMYAGRNVIKMSGSQNGVGINLEELTTAGVPNYVIEENANIEITSGTAGIAARNVYNPQILKNSVHQNTTGSALTYGILLENCDTGLVECNSIISSNISNTSTYGMGIRSTTSTLIFCNEVDSNQVGFHFTGVSPLYFSANTMKNNFWGLEVDSMGTYIDVQPNRGNTWLNYRDTVGAVHWDTTAPGLAASEFKTSGANPSSYWPALPIWNTLWFTPQAGTEDRCGHACDVHEFSDTTRDESFQMLIAEGTLETTEENEVVAQQYLFDLLSADTVMLYSDPVYESFYEEHVTGEVGKINEVTSSFQNILQPANAYFNSLTGMDSLWSLNIQSLQELDSLALANPLIDYTAQQEFLSGQITVLISNLNDLIIDQQQNVVSMINGATLLNNIINPSQLPQANEQFINQMNFELINFGTDGLINYIEQIIEVALQCPSYGGPAVYRARTLANLLNDSLNFEEACLQYGFTRNQNSEHNSVIRPYITIIPNPASDKIIVTLNKKFNGICEMEISDAIGSLVFNETRTCTEKSFSINTSLLKPGVYTVKIMAGVSSSSIVKLVIAR